MAEVTRKSRATWLFVSVIDAVGIARWIVGLLRVSAVTNGGISREWNKLIYKLECRAMRDLLDKSRQNAVSRVQEQMGRRRRHS